MRISRLLTLSEFNLIRINTRYNIGICSKHLLDSTLISNSLQVFIMRYSKANLLLGLSTYYYYYIFRFLLPVTLLAFLTAFYIFSSSAFFHLLCHTSKMYRTSGLVSNIYLRRNLMEMCEKSHFSSNFCT